MDRDLQQNFGTLAVTSDRGSTIGWQFIQGRVFDANNIADSAAGALCITLFTVSLQSVKAALKNPSVSLRTE